MEINYHTISTMKVPTSLNNCSLNLKITKEQKKYFCFDVHKMQKYLYKYYFKVNFYVEYVFVLRNHY